MTRHPMTLHQFYLQLRRDLLKERVQCSEEQAMSLAALALQAEFDDYQQCHSMKNYFAMEHYLPPRILKRTGTFHYILNLSDVNGGIDRCNMYTF